MYSIYNKMFLAIISKFISRIDHLSYFYNNHMTLKLKIIIIRHQIFCQIFSLNISLKISFWYETIVTNVWWLHLNHITDELFFVKIMNHFI